MVPSDSSRRADSKSALICQNYNRDSGRFQDICPAHLSHDTPDTASRVRIFRSEKWEAPSPELHLPPKQPNGAIYPAWIGNFRPSLLLFSEMLLLKTMQNCLLKKDPEPPDGYIDSLPDQIGRLFFSFLSLTLASSADYCSYERTASAHADSLAAPAALLLASARSSLLFSNSLLSPAVARPPSNLRLFLTVFCFFCSPCCSCCLLLVFLLFFSTTWAVVRLMSAPVPSSINNGSERYVPFLLTVSAAGPAACPPVVVVIVVVCSSVFAPLL